MLFAEEKVERNELTIIFLAVQTIIPKKLHDKKSEEEDNHVHEKHTATRHGTKKGTCFYQSYRAQSGGL